MPAVFLFCSVSVSGESGVGIGRGMERETRNLLPGQGGPWHTIHGSNSSSVPCTVCLEATRRKRHRFRYFQAKRRMERLVAVSSEYLEADTCRETALLSK